LVDGNDGNDGIRLFLPQWSAMLGANGAAALKFFGFRPWQARFLVLVLEHSGVCLPRQYRAFAGVAHGRQTHRFFEKLIAGGFATTDLVAPWSV